MDDIELANGAHAEIGRLYRDGKSFSKETPVLSLSFLRGLAVAYCKILDRDLKGNTLAEKIRELDQQGILKFDARKLLKILQLNGNKGAHPESYDFVTLDFPALATESLDAARALIEQLYLLRDGEIPAYEIAPVQSGALKDMCVRAMLERDVQSMYLAGAFFLERAEREPKINVFLEADGYPRSARADVDQSMFWFKQAADAGQPSASYQYGYYLTQHYNVDEDRLSEGERYIARAAENKHADALVYAGNASLEGSQIFAKNEEYAREVFEEAARQGHPMAWAQLGAMYAIGVGGTANKLTAARYTLDAAKAGIPHAQFNMFAMYMAGDGIPKDEIEGIKHLEEAAGQGHPSAIYNLAAYIEVGRVPGRAVEEAEGEYERAMQFTEFRARSALYAAELIERRTNEMSELLKAAKHLQTCYSLIVDNDPHKLRAECLETCQQVVGRIRAHINFKGPDSSLAGDDIFTSALFDRNCIPVVDREERLQYLVGAIKKSSTPSAIAANTEFMLREACLDPRPSRQNIGWSGPITVRPLPRQAVGPLTAPVLTAASNVRRNDPCPCGSGFKFKKCHGR
ncbi:SEC-C metal-binding domain-containing protein [Burkholderia gladioli]|uniref:SEC-C metal-binding domain-containing protein n=1 Tax=Burkholderia gladioli TaxID=28095 RepID=UPI00163F5558|nr:SEC-C metal-binding domain-containing protein [Burkholderia gladioli]